MGAAEPQLQNATVPGSSDHASEINIKGKVNNSSIVLDKSISSSQTSSTTSSQISDQPGEVNTAAADTEVNSTPTTPDQLVGKTAMSLKSQEFSKTQLELSDEQIKPSHNPAEEMSTNGLRRDSKGKDTPLSGSEHDSTNDPGGIGDFYCYDCEAEFNQIAQKVITFLFL